MSHPFTGIDHCVFLVRDLDEARDQMVRLGFAPAPRGVHSDHMGTHNHCVMLSRGYLELLAIRTPTEMNASWGAVVARREGVGALALETTDAASARDVLAARGIEAPEPITFERPVEFDGVADRARFTILTLPEGTGPIEMFACQHHTPDLVWRPEYLTQPNGIDGLVGVVIVVPDPGVAISRLQRLFGDDRPDQDGETQLIDTGVGTIEVIREAEFLDRYTGVPLERSPSSPYVGAVILSSPDPDRTHQYLARNSVSTRRSPSGTLCIAPADACGTMIEIDTGE